MKIRSPMRVKILPDGRFLTVYDLTYGRARLQVSEPDRELQITDEW